MIFFSTSHVTIGYEASRSLLWSEWIGAVPSNEFRHANCIAIRIAEQENPRFWLSNNKQATHLDPEDQTWVNEHIIPRQVNTGIEKMAFIIPDEFYNQMMLDDMISKSADIINYEIQFFGDEWSAREWFLDTDLTAETPPQLVPVAVPFPQNFFSDPDTEFRL